MMRDGEIVKVTFCKESTKDRIVVVIEPDKNWSVAKKRGWEALAKELDCPIDELMKGEYRYIPARDITLPDKKGRAVKGTMWLEVVSASSIVSNLRKVFPGLSFCPEGNGSDNQMKVTGDLRKVGELRTILKSIRRVTV